jgi:YggT family protein
MASFLDFIIDKILALLAFAIIANAILSWLVAFDIINLRNRTVYMIAHFLDAVTRPVLRPFQRFIPPLGGVDVTPIIALLVIQGIRIYILPMIFGPLSNVIG